MTPLKPIQSKKEEMRVRAYLYQTTADTLGISLGEAENRVNALYQTKILQGGHYADPATQQKIENFLRIPSRSYAHLDLSQVGV